MDSRFRVDDLVALRDPLFASSDFFDAQDLLQVRYEMVRLVRLGQATLAEAAQRFGVSRPTCFRMTRAFDQGGLHGLIPETARTTRTAQDHSRDAALR